MLHICQVFVVARRDSEHVVRDLFKEGTGTRLVLGLRRRERILEERDRKGRIGRRGGEEEGLLRTHIYVDLERWKAKQEECVEETGN
jgi:hypothetical protein